MTMVREKTCAIAVMAKAPQAGRSKTRLCPPLDHDQAAALSAAFLRDISDNIGAASAEIPIQGLIAYAPAGSANLFDGHLAPGTDFVLADGQIEAPGGVTGLGKSLLHAIQGLLASGYGAACLLNSDSPTLPTAFLVRAARVLLADGERMVLGPSEDGGYYLIGMKTQHARLFANIAWSTDTVAEATRYRAKALGLEVVELPPWYDVDDAASLDRLAAELAGPADGRFPAPATAAALQGMGRLADPICRAAE